mmetsp:Transcript_12947/g.37968  ORF Transcript_12947/g.37968 Transcript_12947/m.37968 type:complete len:131 (+) Transcript_12947:78-470(+)
MYLDAVSCFLSYHLLLFEIYFVVESPNSSKNPCNFELCADNSSLLCLLECSIETIQSITQLALVTKDKCNVVKAVDKGHFVFNRCVASNFVFQTKLPYVYSKLEMLFSCIQIAYFVQNQRNVFVRFCSFQ